ncbi:hypothetical protein Tco_0187021, partial [Tanacetum coccineum]
GAALASKEKLETSDSNVITPGTQFMSVLSVALHKRSWNEARVGHASLKTDSPSVSHGTTFKAVVQPDLTYLSLLIEKIAGKLINGVILSCVFLRCFGMVEIVIYLYTSICI